MHAHSPADKPTQPWRNPAASIDARARNLLTLLTLDEKIALLHADSKFSTAAPSRLNLPRRWMTDGPNGVREEIGPDTWTPAGRIDDFATALPANVGLAASFDTALAEEYGRVLGEEAAARGKHILLGPGLNIMRTPLNGRNSEYFGEDPFLAARMAVAYIRGVQSQGVAACAKHFALNNQETERETISVEVDERTLHEIYLPAFKASVIEAGVWTIMTGYNRFDGDHCSENAVLLQEILKRDWGFQGLAMSDWNGVHSTQKAALSGLDLEMGTEKREYEQFYFAAPLKAAVEARQVFQAHIDEMALRNLRVMVATGMARDEARAVVGLMAPEHLGVARRVQESACVLLKNEDAILPLDTAKIRTIAVIGANATIKFAHDGNSAAVKTAYEVTPLEGITRHAANIEVTYAAGWAPSRHPKDTTTIATESAEERRASAVEAAKDADAVIVVAGLYRWQDQESADRPDMNLPTGQAEVIAAVAAANPRTIVVLTGGGPVSLDPWIGSVAGLMQYWYGGTEGGTALARLLFGDVSPSGKLPCSFPKRLNDSPAHAGTALNYPGENGREVYAEGLLVGYRWFDAMTIAPHFPFGFGLSYTTFSVTDLQLESQPPAREVGIPLVTVHVTVANTGQRAGAQVVQVYVSQANAPADQPPRELKGFRKVFLQPGQAESVALPLAFSAFAHYDPGRRDWVATAGNYTIFVGDSSRNTPLSAVFTLDTELTEKRERV